MHKITFFPLGNADCCRLDLSDGRKMLFDYAHYRDAEDDDDLRIDLNAALHEDLEAAGRDGTGGIECWRNPPGPSTPRGRACHPVS